MSEVTEYLRGFYLGVYGDLAANAYDHDSDKYTTELLFSDKIEGVVSYKLVNFDTISIKLLAGNRRAIKQLINPLRVCNLLIRVPESLDDYISDLLSVGFRLEGGQSLLLLTRSGDI